MVNSKKTKNAKLVSIIGLIFVPILFAPYVSAQSPKPALWQIRSIDTMKISRDRARAEMNNPAFDKTIEQEMKVIASLGANYVSIGTPYDDEFVPYLKRWVVAARKAGLRVWFRGNFSGWEGWFDYPKTITPQQHLQKTTAFILKYPELFENGDAFDPCPECENGGYWPQSKGDAAYNMFVTEKYTNTQKAFKNINKDVNVAVGAIIGGRAKDVLTKDTVKAIGNIVPIDHYVKDIETMTTYLDYFATEFDAKVLLSEFGAPIPDLNGDMNEDQQAEFVNQIFFELYKRNDKIVGINYWVYSDGSTALVNPDGSLRKAALKLQNYYSPMVISGKVLDSVGTPINGVLVMTNDKNRQSITDTNGYYQLIIPAGTATVVAQKDKYKKNQFRITLKAGESLSKQISLTPTKPTLYFRFKQLLNSFNK